jgi:hypothetical protein
MPPTSAQADDLALKRVLSMWLRIDGMRGHAQQSRSDTNEERDYFLEQFSLSRDPKTKYP